MPLKFIETKTFLALVYGSYQIWAILSDKLVRVGRQAEMVRQASTAVSIGVNAHNWRVVDVVIVAIFV